MARRKNMRRVWHVQEMGIDAGATSCIRASEQFVKELHKALRMRHGLRADTSYTPFALRTTRSRTRIAALKLLCRTP